jgi:hypothetical protein
MRIPLVAIAIACAACTTGPSGPPDTIAGTWSSQSSVNTPAGPMELVLADSGSAVSGSASRAGQTYIVTGQYTRPDVTLTLGPELVGEMVSGYAMTYKGTALNDKTMVLSGTTFRRVGSAP